jgi:hypothetical protein
VAGKDLSEWAESLMLAFGRHFVAWIKSQTAAASTFLGAQPPRKLDV